jgi:hypothetical protein
MNITDGYLYDPRSHGEFRDPFMQLRVDEPVFEQAPPVFDGRKSAQYRVIPCGPFYAVEHREDNGAGYSTWDDIAEFEKADVGVLNASGLLKDQLAPVNVVTPDEELDLFMIVTRVRRLVRKHAKDYRLMVDEEAALLGRIKWRLELSDPVCYGGAVPGGAACRNPGPYTIVHKDTHLSLCDKHLGDHQARMRTRRYTTKTL